MSSNGQHTYSALAFLTVQSQCAPRVYTDNEDFAKGVLINLNTDTAGELRLNATPRPLPQLWMPCTQRGTICCIDVNTGVILGEYRTAAERIGEHDVWPEPSRTAVDAYGNCWVANRADNVNVAPLGEPEVLKGTVTRVGLVLGGVRGRKEGGSFIPDPAGEYLSPPFLYNTCLDRDGDGFIRTSRALAHVLEWPIVSDMERKDGAGHALDEAILNYVRCDVQGARTLAVDANNDVWVGGYNNGVHLKLNGNTAAEIPGTRYPPEGPGLYGGYGGAINAYGTLWSAGGNGAQYLLRGYLSQGQWVWDPRWIFPHGGHGLAIDPRSQIVWTTTRESAYVARYDANGLPLHQCYHGYPEAQGGCVDSNDNVWVAHVLYAPPGTTAHNTVGHVRSDGDQEWVGNVHLSLSPNIERGPTALTVDSNGKVWVASYNSSLAMRIDPDSGPYGKRNIPIGRVDLVVNLGQGTEHSPPHNRPAWPYAYSDMTAFAYLAVTAQRGSWLSVHDGGAAGKQWASLTWVASTPPGTSVRVEVRAADSKAGLPGQGTVFNLFREVASGVPFTGVVGRYIELRATLSRDHGVSQIPALQQLTVHCPAN
ncbi:MAG: hypothetical protein FJ387_28105 [Verrucomicrobia bacterium]|nr:hypothetical protein [Verrucomicrobiota bacterium]